MKIQELNSLRKKQLELRQPIDQGYAKIDEIERLKASIKDLQDIADRYKALFPDNNASVKETLEAIRARELPEVDESEQNPEIKRQQEIAQKEALQQRDKDMLLFEENLRLHKELTEKELELQKYENHQNEIPLALTAFKDGRKAPPIDDFAPSTVKKFTKMLQKIYIDFTEQGGDIRVNFALSEIKIKKIEDGIEVHNLPSLPHIIETYTAVKKYYDNLLKYEERPDIEREKIYVMSVMGWLDAMATRQYHEEIRAITNDSRNAVQQMADKFDAIAFQPSSHDLLKCHENDFPSSISPAQFGYLIVLADVHGNPSFVTDYLQSLEDPLLSDEVKGFITNIGNFEIFRIGQSVRLAAEPLEVNAETTNNWMKQKNVDEKTAKQQLEQRIQLVQSRKTLINNRFTTTTDVEKPSTTSFLKPKKLKKQRSLLGVMSFSTSTSKLAEPERETFTLQESVAVLESAHDSVHYLQLSSGLGNGDTTTSFIGKKPVRDPQKEGGIGTHYTFYDASVGYLAFKTADKLRGFLESYVQHKASITDANQPVPTHFSLRQLHPDALQRCADTTRVFDSQTKREASTPILYNKPYKDTAIETWQKPDFTGMETVASSQESLSPGFDREGKTFNYTQNVLIVTEEPDAKDLAAIKSIVTKHPHETICIYQNPNQPEKYKAWAINPKTGEIVPGLDRLQPIGPTSRVQIFGTGRSLSDISFTSPHSSTVSSRKTSEERPRTRGMSLSAAQRPDSRNSVLTEGSIESYRDPIRTIAHLPLNEFAAKFDSLISNLNAQLSKKISSKETQKSFKEKGLKSPHTPRQINIIDLNPVTGSPTMGSSLAKELTHEFYNRGIDCPVSAIEAAFDFSESGHKIKSSDQHRDESVSEFKNIYKITDGTMTTTEGIPKNYVGIVTNKDEAEQTITVGKYGQTRPDAPTQSIYVGDDIGKYEKNDRVNVKRTETDIEVTKQSRLQKMRSTQLLGGTKGRS